MQKWNPAAEKMIHMKYRLILSFFFPSFNTHGVILDWNLWDVCSSNLVSLIQHWFTIWYSNLAEAQFPWLYLVRHTPAHNICQNMWPSCILFSFFPGFPLHVHPTTTAAAFFPSILSPSADPPLIRRTKATRNSWWQTETFLSIRSHSLMSVNVDENAN